MAVAGPETLTARSELGALTMIPLCVPVMAGVSVSVAVMDCCMPAVLKVALNEPVPFGSVESGGKEAWPSLLVK